MRRVAGAIALSSFILFVVACTGRAPAAESSLDPATEGLQAFDRGDWIGAARILRDAVARDPSSLKLHYSLAIASTYLERRDDAIGEFQWVLANAPAGSNESDTARQWLADAGVRPGVSIAPGTAAVTAANAPAAARADVTGHVIWNEPDASVNPARLPLFLQGIAGSPTQEEYYVLRTDQDGRFEFTNVAPGPYKLVDRVAGKPQWRLRVELAPAQRLALDLTPSNSTRVRDDFPEDE